MRTELKKFVPIDSDNQELSLPSANLVSVYFDYSVNEMPKLKITLSVSKDKLYKFNQYKCIIKFSDGTESEEFDFFVGHINEVSSSTTVLTGLMCTYEQATIYKSVSLGNDPVEAISQLGFKRKIVSLSKPSIKFNYLQFNETANDALLKLLIGNSPYSYGVITDKIISTIDFNGLNKLDESTFFTYEVNSSNNSIYVSNKYDVTTEAKNHQIEFSSSFAKSKFNLYQSSINGESIIYDEFYPQEFNALCTRKFMGTLNKSMDLKLNNPLHKNRPNIGDIVKCKGFQYFNTSDSGFPAMITKCTIYENADMSSYVYRLERI